MKDFTLYSEALELKQLGFNEPCFGFWNYNDSKMYYWNDEEIQNERTNTWFLDTEKKFPKISKNGCTAPTFSQAFRWFREKYNLHALIMPKTTPSNTTVYYIYKGKFEENWDNCFEAYEEAELACLREMIKLVKK
jgi:hypothetical protein